MSDLADIPAFSAAVDQVWKSFSSEEVVIDPKKVAGLDERASTKYIEREFQQQLQRARSAFLAEFRNHSVVVESEVKRIREELTAQLEKEYGEKIAMKNRMTTDLTAQVSRCKDEIVHLKNLATAQEAYLTAVRHRYGFEQKEQMKAEVKRLQDEFEASRLECADLSHQLMCRDELVAQLRGELATLEDKLERQATAFAEKEKEHDEELRSLRLEMRQKEERFTSHLHAYEEKFSGYREKTSEELNIQAILNRRRSEALKLMEEERERHIKARTKPTKRIGVDRELEEKMEPYDLAKDKQYRVDPMGMDTSWRDYQIGDLRLVPPGRQPRPPKFKVHKNLGPVAPTASEVPNAEATPGPRLPAVQTLDLNLGTPRQRWADRPPVTPGA